MDTSCRCIPGMGGQVGQVGVGRQVGQVPAGGQVDIVEEGRHSGHESPVMITCSFSCLLRLVRPT